MSYDTRCHMCHVKQSTIASTSSDLKYICTWTGCYYLLQWTFSPLSSSSLKCPWVWTCRWGDLFISLVIFKVNISLTTQLQEERKKTIQLIRLNKFKRVSIKLFHELHAINFQSDCMLELFFFCCFSWVFRASVKMSDKLQENVWKGKKKITISERTWPKQVGPSRDWVEIKKKERREKKTREK